MMNNGTKVTFIPNRWTLKPGEVPDWGDVQPTGR